MLTLCDVPVFFERTSHNNMTTGRGVFRPALRLAQRSHQIRRQRTSCRSLQNARTRDHDVLNQQSLRIRFTAEDEFQLSRCVGEISPG
jgi:hypothetical protein